MATKASVYIAASLDGYIARSDGSLDWLLSLTTPDDHDSFAQFMANIDAVVMGRGTFETVLAMGEWPFAGKRVVVLGTTLSTQDIPAPLRDAVELHAGPPASLVQHLAAVGSPRLYVDGGKTIRSFLREGLIDEITINHVPVLLGSGIPLFGDLPADIKLRHMATQTFAVGFVRSRYEVVR